jgi:hypothetical protein
MIKKTWNVKRQRATSRRSSCTDGGREGEMEDTWRLYVTGNQPEGRQPRTFSLERMKPCHSGKLLSTHNFGLQFLQVYSCRKKSISQKVFVSDSFMCASYRYGSQEQN